MVLTDFDVARTEPETGQVPSTHAVICFDKINSSIEVRVRRVAGRRLLTTHVDFIIIISITTFTTVAVAIIIAQKAGILSILLPVFLRSIPSAHTSLVGITGTRCHLIQKCSRLRYEDIHQMDIRSGLGVRRHFV